MKLSLPSVYTQKKRVVVPPIPFERSPDEDKELQKHEYITFKLRSTPDDAESTTFDLTVPFFKSGTPEQLLITVRRMNQVLIGQHVTQGPGKYAIARRIFQGEALSVFDRLAGTTMGADGVLGAETDANFVVVIEGLKRHVFPRRAYAVQKRYMHRFVRKSQALKTREFMARLAELNSYLTQFPPQQVGGPAIDPLDDDEVKDIGEFAVPASWQKGMVQHGFDPADHTLTEFVEFCERFEYTEDPEWKSVGPRAKTSQNGGKGDSNYHAKTSVGGKPKSSGGNPNNNLPNNRKRKYDPNAYCKYHKRYGHFTDKCEVVLAQIAAMQGAYDAHDDSHKRANFGNKTWTRNPTKDSLTHQQKSKEELHALMEARVEEEVEKRINKRQRELAALTAEEFEQLMLSDSESDNDNKEKKE